MAIFKRIEGMDEILKDLRQVEGEARQRVYEILRDETKPVVEDARSRAPKDTGAMARGIKRSVSKKKLEAKISAGGMVGGVDTYYAFFVEEGTKNKPARPFLFPACRAHEERIGKALSDAMYDLIRKGKA
jgi:HK97 gp10 family phage protein